MKKTGESSSKVREFIVDNVGNHPSDTASVVAKHFSITRQAVNQHLKILIEQKILSESGKTRNKKYKLNSTQIWKNNYHIDENLAESTVWKSDIEPQLLGYSENVMDILHYAFTEIFNNAIDHSEGDSVTVKLFENVKFISFFIFDDGIGIFKKIKDSLNLQDEKYAIFELSKGKLTTDPKNHTGEGIFFTSRMVNQFMIFSRKIGFSHKETCEFDFIIDEPKDELKKCRKGTAVFFEVAKNSKKDIEKIFLEFTPGESFSFQKTVVSIRLVEYGEKKLISRSQAKRVLNRINLFKKVILDFSGITFIGQGFADEIFRVFRNANPNVEIIGFNMCTKVKNMVAHVEGN